MTQDVAVSLLLAKVNFLSHRIYVVIFTITATLAKQRRFTSLAFVVETTLTHRFVRRIGRAENLDERFRIEIARTPRFGIFRLVRLRVGWRIRLARINDLKHSFVAFDIA